MNVHRWLPWRYVVRRFARAHGFIDPVMLYARLQQFAQPSEVAEPVELLRAGAVFHARGLINSRALQHNLDWVWPYWVNRQFDPTDVSFLPRAFSLTHVNLTHRNWTGIGLPGREAIPIVDPRGLLTPYWDGWSIDAWCMDDDDHVLLPSRAMTARQWQSLDQSLSVHTHSKELGMQLETVATLVDTPDGDVCRMSVKGTIPDSGWLMISARPCNPEGVSFIDQIKLNKDRRSWLIDKHKVKFDQEVEIHHASCYRDADVFVHLHDREEELTSKCPVGLATAVALFRVRADRAREVVVDIPLQEKRHKTRTRLKSGLASKTKQPEYDGSESSRNDMANQSKNTAPVLRSNWTDALQSAVQLQIPDEHVRSLYRAALGTLILCTPGDVFAGPYTYKRYWYRDATFIGHGLLCAGLLDRAQHIIEHFPDRQDSSGYYHSQEGEWDSNGEVLWLMDRYRQFRGRSIPANLNKSIKTGAEWIDLKRAEDFGGNEHEGLLPAGFSAEHLGPNDHYYWDNYWAVAGLDSAARIADGSNLPTDARLYRKRSEQLQSAIARSLERLSNRPDMPAIPAAPTRRMDAGAIGSVVASYPLQLCAPKDKSMLGLLDYLLNECFHRNGFFQDMIHSGTNAYLTLHVAQALLRADDQRFFDLVRNIASLASPTGHWPEAIHPHTGGGCMGDGHHAWAAAEWVCMVRYMFVREELDTLILGSGLLPEWLQTGEALHFGPAPTLFGSISITIPEFEHGANAIELQWVADWHKDAPSLLIQIPGFEAVSVDKPQRAGSVNCQSCTT